MAIILLLIFAGAVLTVLFWASVIAVAVAIFEILGLAIRGVFWLITRPIVWFVITPLRFIFGGSATNDNHERARSIDVPNLGLGTGGSTASDKLSQLTALKRLMDNSTITVSEFEKPKADLLR